MIPEHLIWPAALPKTSDGHGFSILSHNILLPNSSDAWWTYKMYPHEVLLEQQDDEAHITAWEFRRALIEERVRTVDADVVCFQEVSPTSFEVDFRFMEEELGYDGCALYKKGRFRPATFWKTSELTLVAPEVHKDRCLLTAFQRAAGKGDGGINDQLSTPSLWFVANCHLQAGQNGPRRVRQIQEAIKGILTLARKLKVPAPEQSCRMIVCGDFNGGAESGAIRYLEDGFVDESWLEDGVPVTSSRKDLPLSKPLLDVSVAIADRDPPPTLVVSELMSTLMDDVSYRDPKLSQGMKDRLKRIYKKLATGEDGQMTNADVERWLILINKQLCRGDEYRNAAIAMGFVDPIQDENESWDIRKKRIRLPEDGILTLDGFMEVYQKELEGGKFWGINHDMSVLGDGLPEKGLFCCRYDRIYYNGESIAPVAVLDTLSSKPCPNDKEPSDHLPVAATFRAV